MICINLTFCSSLLKENMQENIHNLAWTLNQIHPIFAFFIRCNVEESLQESKRERERERERERDGGWHETKAFSWTWTEDVKLCDGQDLKVLGIRTKVKIYPVTLFDFLCIWLFMSYHQGLYNRNGILDIHFPDQASSSLLLMSQEEGERDLPNGNR